MPLFIILIIAAVVIYFGYIKPMHEATAQTAQTETNQTAQSETPQNADLNQYQAETDILEYYA